MTIRFILLLLLSLLLPSVSNSQGIRPSNIYRVTVTSDYVINNGERTPEYFAVNQEIFDSLGRLHTEIEYDRVTRQPDNYRWHYYDSMELVRTDSFEKGKLGRRLVYNYNQGGQVTGELHYIFNDGDSVLLKYIEIIYNSAGLPLELQARNASGRRLYRTVSSFDGNGNEIRRRVTGRRGDPKDNIRRLDREPLYDSLGRLVSETVHLRLADRSREVHIREYRHDNQGNIIGQRELDKQGNQISRIEYFWQQNRGRITRVIFYDADDRLEKYYSKRYEIYRSSDRRQRVIDY